MQKSKKILIAILSIVGIGVIVIGLFFWMLVYESRKDISTKKPYVSFLNTPHIIKDTTTIRWYDTNLRFSHYALVTNEYSHFNEDEVKSVKHYFPGDTVMFHSAKSYYSIHVDNSYYLIGSDTLDSGEVVEFEYNFHGGNPDDLFGN
ncbi:hypothetical protein WNY78_17150 [Psychroserpens sp. AS72]|uniref:hypothetical protein n=1 Tax=Psychroserpens sp. AS72 TaxID=3135775 RepID=UPI00317DB85A